MGSDQDSVITDCSVFFNDLYHRFLLTPKVEMKCLCLQAMAIVYGRHWEVIGPFHDTRYILAMLDRSVDRQERDRLVLFISKLILHKENVVDVLKASGLKTLVELITLAHLHTSRYCSVDSFLTFNFLYIFLFKIFYCNFLLFF